MSRALSAGGSVASNEGISVGKNLPELTKKSGFRVESKPIWPRFEWDAGCFTPVRLWDSDVGCSSLQLASTSQG